MQRTFYVTFLKLLRTAFLYYSKNVIVASDLIEYLETLTINEDLLKSLKILIIVNFTENI